jgi:hypothetical protein
VPEGSGPLLFPKTTLLLAQHLSFFLKSGFEWDSKTPTELLNVDFRDPKLQLNKKEVFIRSKARSFIAKMGLTSESPELYEFFAGVTG